MYAQRRGANSTRRTFLKATGAGAAAVGASALLPATAMADDDDDEDYDGLLVFVYDDSPAEDYSKTYRVHREYDVPGCVAALPGLMEGGTSDWLLPGHMQAMHQDGWEFMSHTLIHRDLGEVPVLESVEAGETEIPVRSNLAGRFEGDPIVFIDGDNEVEATVAGRRDGGGEDEEDDGYDDLEDEEEADETRYLILEEGLEEDISSDAVVRYTDEFTEQILSESQEMLEGWLEDQGGVVNGYVHTYDRTEGVQNFVPQFYDSNPNARPGRGGLNPEHEPDPLSLHRAYFETDYMEDDELLDFLDSVAGEPDFGILAGHSHFSTLPEERIQFAIEAALERNIKIVTMQEAMHRLGVWEVQDEQIRASMEDDGDDGTPDGDDGDANGDDDVGAAGADDDDGDDTGDVDEGGESLGLLDRILAFLRSLFGR
ncbi:polysaccharide deacetylase family protein [Natronorarus salvus]|uniref:polysaccharide deacetylase family protein n=1 Tax=Natronorarus salvus TaxID=3117733 RepID=UPI002F25FE84